MTAVLETHQIYHMLHKSIPSIKTTEFYVITGLIS